MKVQMYERTVTMMPEEIEILGTELALINKYLPLKELYQVCKDLQDDKAIMLIGRKEHPARTEITITWR